MKNRTQSVIILDLRNVVANGSEQVISRHRQYADLLASRSRLKLHIHSKSQRIIEDLGHMSHSTSGSSIMGFINYLKSLKEYLKSNNLEPVLLIAGDPWESLLAARLFRLIYNRQIPIQVQFHGDVASNGWKYLNIRNYFRYYLTFLSLGNMQNMYFRTTSRTQFSLLEKTFHIPSSKNSVLPVVLNLSAMISGDKVDSLRIRVAFVGRLHKDRGTQKFIEVIEKLDSIHEKLDIVIIGDGPERNWLTTQFNKLSPRLKFNFMGYLGSSELQHVWDNVDVLLSLAPFESYGLTIREALICGTPVLALPSSGVQDLNEAIINKWVQLISDPISELELIQQVQSIKNIRIPNEYRQSLALECGRGNLELVSRWIEIVEISESSKEGN